MKKKFVLVTISCLILLGSICYAHNFKMSFPINVSKSPDYISRWPDIAFDSNGHVHICWDEFVNDTQGSTVMYATYDGIKWTKFRLDKPEQPDKGHSNIAVGADGTIAVFWDHRASSGEDLKIYGSIYSPTEDKWTPTGDIGTGYTGWLPHCAVDSFGNVYVSWFSDRGRSFSRSRINGKWESVYVHSAPYAQRSTQTDITCANDDTIWMIFRLKFPDGGNYRSRYQKRTKDTSWSRAKPVNDRTQSQDQPMLCTSPDGTPYVYYQESWHAAGVQTEIIEIKIDEITNPQMKIQPLDLIHFPSAAFDIYENKYLAWQIGPGEWGMGVLYSYYEKDTDTWSDPVLMPNSGSQPKLPNMAADIFGNVGLVWASGGYWGQKEIHFSSILPVKSRGIKPPINLSLSIDVNNLAGALQVVYNLSWEKDPKTNDTILKGYNLYRKEPNGEYQLFRELDKNELSHQVVIRENHAKYLFALTAITTSNFESKKVEFIPTE